MTTLWSNKLFPVLKGVIAFFVVTLSLFHIFFNAEVPGVSELKKQHKNVVTNRNEVLSSNLSLLKNKQISNDEYIKIIEFTLKNSTEEIAELNKQKKILAHAHSFRGRSSFHFWLFVFGLVLALFFFSCKSLYDDISRGSTYKFQFVSLTGILISGFWFIHLIFLTQKDFAQNKYISTIIIGAIVFSVFVYSLVKHYTYKDDIIYKQLSFIKRVKKIYYDDIAFRAMYAEKSGKAYESEKSLNDCIDEFQEDLKQVTSNI